MPFALEKGGRVEVAARAMARRVALTDPVARTAAIADLWQTVGLKVQRANALHVLAAVGR